MSPRRYGLTARALGPPAHPRIRSGGPSQNEIGERGQGRRGGADLAVAEWGVEEAFTAQLLPSVPLHAPAAPFLFSISSLNPQSEGARAGGAGGGEQTSEGPRAAERAAGGRFAKTPATLAPLPGH